MRIYTVCVSLLAVFFVTACDWDFDSNSFDYNLQGTWVTNSGGYYSGTLIITSDRITIQGYQALWSNDNQCPFKDFPRGYPLKGYSDKGKLFIEYGGVLKEIPYEYTAIYPSPYYDRERYLLLHFGGRPESLIAYETSY
ncbi:MAG: hypothetical protein LBI28_06645 [Treponema sp.]|jgi:hypothetical protein|nr:hypothetical protein [Treponema sp.]